MGLSLSFRIWCGVADPDAALRGLPGLAGISSPKGSGPGMLGNIVDETGLFSFDLATDLDTPIEQG